MPGFTAPKLLWLKRHEPESFARIAKVVSPKDFLRLRLTGEAATDMSDAAGTLWLDQAARDWSDAILAATGLDRVTDAAAGRGERRRAGKSARDVCEAWEIEGPVVVAGGAGDAAAAAIGIGAVEDGDAFISLGTSAQFFVTDDRYRPQPETLLHAFAHALPGRWFRMAAMLNGASCLEWWRGSSARPTSLRCSSGRRRHIAGRRACSSSPISPASARRTTIRFARGVFFGARSRLRPTDLVQAVLEGVAFSLLEAQQLMDCGGRPARVGRRRRRRARGAASGCSSSRMCWGCPVMRYAASEKGPAFGAARLARMALTGENRRRSVRQAAVLDDLAARPGADDSLQRALRDLPQPLSRAEASSSIGWQTVRMPSVRLSN